jgi:hypothetical protein
MTDEEKLRWGRLGNAADLSHCTEQVPEVSDKRGMLTGRPVDQSSTLKEAEWIEYWKERNCAFFKNKRGAPPRRGSALGAKDAAGTEGLR